jgi:hypothetical protein
MSDPLRTSSRPPSCEPITYIPTRQEIDAVIAAARRHPLGLGYLREGALDNVAVTLSAHAFTVVAARELLARHES